MQLHYFVCLLGFVFVTDVAAVDYAGMIVGL